MPRTTYIKVESEAKAPEKAIKNLTRPNLFGCFYKECDKEIKRDFGLLEKGADLELFVKKLNSGFMELLNEDNIQFHYNYGLLEFERRADVTVYYLGRM